MDQRVSIREVIRSFIHSFMYRIKLSNPLLAQIRRLGLVCLSGTVTLGCLGVLLQDVRIREVAGHGLKELHLQT